MVVTIMFVPAHASAVSPAAPAVDPGQHARVRPQPVPAPPRAALQQARARARAPRTYMHAFWYS
jgi:hypothetical protein